MQLREEQGATLLRYARACVAQALGGPQAVPPEGAWTKQPAATFVTLHRGETLQGCVGTLQARHTLVEDVAKNAVAAALEDPRAKRMSLADVDQLTVEISLLSAFERIPIVERGDEVRCVRPFVDGVVFGWQGRQATFLPQVWKTLPEPEEFMARLKRKAGLPRSFWAPDIELTRYGVQKWVASPAPLPD